MHELDESHDPDSAARKLLARLGAAMIATGQPVHEIEEELAEIGARLGYPDLQLGVSTTGLILSLRSGCAATYESVTAPIRLDQTSEVRRIRHQLVHDGLAPAEALRELSTLRVRPARYPQWIAALAWGRGCLRYRPDPATGMVQRGTGRRVFGRRPCAADAGKTGTGAREPAADGRRLHGHRHRLHRG